MRKLLVLVGTLLIGLAAQAAPGDVFLLQIPSINGAVNFSKYRGWRTETLTISAQQIQISSTPQSADGSVGGTTTTDVDCQNGTIQ